MPASDHVDFAALEALMRAILERHGCSPKVAGILAANCAAAERDGSTSHGLFRMPDYVSDLRSQWVDGTAEPIVFDVAPGTVRVDARNGYAQVALAVAKPLLLQKARQTGIAVLAIRQSHHLGALYLDVEDIAEQGLVALTVSNSIGVVAPHGARKPVLGTNPIAFAAPAASGAPLIFDMASSAMSHGDVRVAAREGRAVAPGVGIDRDGQPTTDPAAILHGGALLPFGGHKGSAIAMMAEILCAALCGAAFSFEVDWSRHPGARTPCTGQTVIVIDPAAGAEGLPALPMRVDTLMAALREAGQSHLPGERRLLAREQAARHGIPMEEPLWSIVKALLHSTV